LLLLFQAAKHISTFDDIAAMERLEHFQAKCARFAVENAPNTKAGAFSPCARTAKTL
jgi:hypothetical protein